MIRTALPIALTFSLIACSGAANTPPPLPEGTLTSTDGYKLVPLAEGLEVPWGIAALPDGSLLVTEREGRLRLLNESGLVEAPVSGLPDDILVQGQGGLLGLALDPEFEDNRKLYVSYSKDMGDTNTTAVFSATLSDDAMSLSDVTNIFLGEPRSTAYHYGGRLAFMPDGSLVVTLGDGYRYKDDAQTTDNLHGKMARIMPDGSLPTDNPFADGSGHPALYSYGHRNIQGVLYDTERGLLFAHEHGPKGGDELNIVEPGKNYGWPAITYGINYNGSIITDQTEAPGMEQPVVKWVPSIAPSGMTLVETDGFEAWDGDILIGGMLGPKGQKLVRVDLADDGSVIGTEDLLVDLELAYRDVIATDNAIYVATTGNIEDAIYQLVKVE